LYIYLSIYIFELHLIYSLKKLPVFLSRRKDAFMIIMIDKSI